MAKAGLLFVGTHDGMVLFSDPGGIGRWLRVGHTLRDHLVQAIWLEAGNPLVVLAALGEAGLQRSTDGGQTWQRVLGTAEHLTGSTRHMPQRVYAATSSGELHRSDDSGIHWAACTPGEWSGQITALALSSAGDETVYVGALDGQVWRSANGGAAWARYSAPLEGPPTLLIEAPERAGMWYTLSRSHLFTTTTEAWTPFISPDATALALLGGKQPTILLGGAMGIQRSNDGGLTWASVDATWNAAVTVITAASYHIDTAFAGSADGELAVSTNRGRAWQILRSDLPAVTCIAAARLV